MADQKLKLLMQSLGGQVLQHVNNPSATVALLISETVKFRNKLKAETGTVLTVEDTRRALEALELALKDKPAPTDLSEEQRALAQIFVDRVTLFGG